MQSVGGERAGWAAQESETRTCPKSSVPGAVGSDSRPATVSREPYQAKGCQDLRRGGVWAVLQHILSANLVVSSYALPLLH